MLNISDDQLHEDVDLDRYPAFQKVTGRVHYKYFNRLLGGFAIIAFIMLFLPWTQNVTGRGFVTTLTPGQRPQTIQSPIPGRIEEWYVREGDFVAKGDTILRISEIKTEYQDPQLVERTEQRRQAKSRSVQSYSEKIDALTNQIAALGTERSLKLEQARNKLQQANLKVESDSIDLVAVRTNLGIAEAQYERNKALFEEGGLISKQKVEDKKLKLQELQAKEISKQNDLLASRNEVLNAEIELNSIQANYAEKIAKARSDRSTAQSDMATAEADVSKLEIDRSSYEVRTGLYHITAPQSGYINKAIKGGLGETFKEGERLVGIMPAGYDLAVETFIEPLDLPLMHVGENVRIQFDGWPAIVFNGWPNVSFGTYGGKVVAVETFISDNGKFRVLIAPDEDDHEWPQNIRVGSGAYTIALLNDVPIWYEIWRQLNGFPPDYYTPEEDAMKDGEKKK